jgi:uncharacterized SAM-binding protein YcdF (DUF218 family)
VSVDVIVVSNAIARADTLTAAALYRDGVSRRIVLPWWQPEPLDLELQALGVPWLPPTDLALAILEKKGVPRTAVEVLKDPVDGLNAEVASVGRWAQARRPKSLMFVTARSHSRRARWLLERVVPPGTRIVVRGSDSDPFDPHAWWHSRAGGREVAMEYLRWVNTFVLHDPWGTKVPVVPEAAR